ncbi:MAG: D-alanine--D-alanine ligase [Clostridia bacterium]|nr:D-alanine--D-alanine ligase [Clostridia bacterium]
MKKLGVIFGGMSTENEVSKMSGESVLKNLNKDKYEVFPIYIDLSGQWFEYETNKRIENVIEYIKQLDVVFPVLHGLYGEDGTIQGLLELAKMSYVGCKVLASSVGMDKAYTKIVFEKAGLNQAKYVYIKKYKSQSNYIYVDDEFNEKIVDLDEIVNIVKSKTKYPVFVKPSNSGSSVGVNKAENDEQLKENIKVASEFDSKILIEEGIIGKEVECAVLGNSEVGVQATDVGEILSAEDFYTFDAKYKNQESKTLIPARITSEQREKIRELAAKAFMAIDGNGLSRVDFFVENGTGKIYINEINTMPGFTSISMYPKLFEAYGINYSDLLDKLIEMC